MFGFGKGPRLPGVGILSKDQKMLRSHGLQGGGRGGALNLTVEQYVDRTQELSERRSTKINGPKILSNSAFKK